MAATRRVAYVFAASFVVFASACTYCNAEEDLARQARMTLCELATSFDYPCEISHVTTEDGYLLELDRVQRGREHTATGAKESNGTRGYPVLFLPACTTTSDIWLLNYPSQAPGFLYADAGFDAWFLHTRETERYANHTDLSKNDPEYWKFSFEEIGRYDVAAGIDHVLNATGAPKLTVITYSQGAMDMLALLSMRPEYNDKVDLVVAYGPGGNTSRMGPPMSLVMPFTPLITAFVYPFSKAGYVGTSDGLSELLAELCKIFNGKACALGFLTTLYASPYQLNATRLPVYVGHVPVGSTLQNMNHYYQIYRAKDFVMYDHGAKENRKRYGQTKPPAYPLECITARWAIFSSEGDQLANPRVVGDLVARLGPRVILHRVVPQRTLRHLDFVLGYRATDFLHNVAIDTIKQNVDRSPSKSF
ncbi:lipase lipl-1 [Rhipicephalus sanguineus]|uniref:lipase lipl-1 n=1 Tax=Rhipicephalus sanguineus TaxID=34632 RepID=UPI0020C572D9|nr:lipase lipl-1 [Rhipicephalus sanguineus]